MSFSSKVKNELTKIQLRTKTEKLCLLCSFTNAAGSLVFAGKGALNLTYTTENPRTARLVAKVATGLYEGVAASIELREYNRLNTKTTVTTLSGDLIEMLKDIGIVTEAEDGINISGSIDQRFFDDEKKQRAFLRGAFLGAGSISDPQKGYHLEIISKSEKFSAALLRIMRENGINARLARRKSSDVVYIKEGEAVSDFFAFIGASEAIMEFENVRIVKDIKNRVNRTLNCESSNMQKTAKAAAYQLICIERISDSVGLSALPEDIRAIAEARVNNPEASLQEIADMLEIKKSAVNHRIRKITAIAERM